MDANMHDRWQGLENFHVSQVLDAAWQILGGYEGNAISHNTLGILILLDYGLQR